MTTLGLGEACHDRVTRVQEWYIGLQEPSNSRHGRKANFHMILAVCVHVCRLVNPDHEGVLKFERPLARRQRVASIQIQAKRDEDVEGIRLNTKA